MRVLFTFYALRFSPGIAIMKRNHTIILLAIIILSIAGLWLWRSAQAGSGLAQIRQRGVLRVGLDASFPPFETLDGQGEVVGLDADIARLIAADLGVTVEFVSIGFDGLYDALKIGRVDLLLSGLPIDPYLTEDVAYSVPYFNAGQVLVTSRVDIQSVDDLAGQSVAVEWGSMADMEARQLRKTIDTLTVDARPDPASALQAEIAIVDGVSALANPALRQVVYLSDAWFAAAVEVENKALLAEVNKTLTRLRENAPAPCYLQLPRTPASYPGDAITCYAE